MQLHSPKVMKEKESYSFHDSGILQILSKMALSLTTITMKGNGMLNCEYLSEKCDMTCEMSISE